jgi:mannosyltransferase
MTRNLTVKLDGVIFGLQTYGGISNYWGRLLRQMDAQANIESQMLLPKHIRYAEYDSKWHTNSSIRKEVLPTRLARYLDVMDNRPCDVFHSSYFRVPTSRSTKYVVTVYDFIYERYRHGLARWVHSIQKIRSIRRADAVICISEATRDDVLRYVPGVDPERLHVVYLGVDQNTYFPVQTATVEKLQNMVLYVGQRGGYKRFDLAVESLAQCPQLSLGIVGPIPSPSEVELLESRLHGRWHSFGPVSSARLRELYSTVFAFIFPSDYEGFGLPILEAMACGCPVVASHRSSLPEVGGQAAFYAHEQRPEAFAAALTKLQKSESERDKAIAFGMKHAKGFSWERTFEETLAIYRG